MKFEEVEIGKFYITESSEIYKCVYKKNKNYPSRRILAENYLGIGFRFVDIDYNHIKKEPKKYWMTVREANDKEIKLFNKSQKCWKLKRIK